MALTYEEAKEAGVSYRAPVGGCYAANGEFYRGGLFVNVDKQDGKTDCSGQAPAAPDWQKVGEVISPEAQEIVTGETISADSTWEFSTLFDIARKCAIGRTLSERQISFARDLTEKVIAQRAPVVEGPKHPAPSGLCTVSGVVLATKYVESEDGRFSSLKMLVQCDGFKVWSTVPASFDGGKGDGIEFTAVLSPSLDDPYFARASRPRKARRIECAQA